MVQSEIIRMFSEKFGLTQRQEEVLTLLINDEAISAKELAAKLGCSRATANVHLSHIFSKTGCRNKAAIIKLMMQIDASFSAGLASAANDLMVLSAADDPRFHKLMSRVVEVNFLNRITVVPCRHGQEVLMHLSRVKQDDPQFPRPDIILLDLHMPVLDGFETLKRIKSDPNIRDIPVIAFSDELSTEQRETVFALGANSFFKKPRSADYLEKTVQVFLQYWSL